LAYNNCIYCIDENGYNFYSGVRIKDQGTRNKEQGTRNKEQGTRNKEQGTRK
jgi:hypothetical protein